MRRVSLLISGRVQGVGFRYHTRDKAVQLGVVGEVKNLADGRVAVIAQAEADTLELFIAWCHNGSEMARVNNVTMSELAVDDSLTAFVISHL